MAGDYKFMFVNLATGENVGEFPLADVTFSYRLNGVGQLTATAPADAYFMSQDYLGAEFSITSITVLRDEVPVWFGFITNLNGTRRGGWEITAREAHWILSKRTIEDDLTYTSEDIFQIVRDLVNYALTKTANGSDGMTAGANINAAFAQFDVMAGTAGVTKSYNFYGNQGYTIQQAIDQALVADPTTGLDYAMDYRVASTRQYCVPRLIMGSPSLGVQQEIRLRASDLYDYSRTLDWEQAATRVTELGPSGYIKRLQSASAVAASAVLLENVTDCTSLADSTAVDDFARDDRRARKPPLHDRWVEFTPTDNKIPFDQYSVGDLVAFDVDGPGLLQLSAQSRRCLQIDVWPQTQGSPERVRLTVSTLVDDLAE